MIALFMVAGVCSGRCQGKRVSVARGMCPLRGGVIEKYERPYLGTGRPSIGETILGQDSLVYAVKGGIVENVFTFGDEKVIMVRLGKLFYTYATLDTVFAAKGAPVKAGECIGVCRGQSLDFVISDSRNKLYWPDRYLDCRIKVVRR